MNDCKKYELTLEFIPDVFLEVSKTNEKCWIRSQPPLRLPSAGQTLCIPKWYEGVTKGVIISHTLYVHYGENFTYWVTLADGDNYQLCLLTSSTKTEYEYI